MYTLKVEKHEHVWNVINTSDGSKPIACFDEYSHAVVFSRSAEMLDSLQMTFALLGSLMDDINEEMGNEPKGDSDES